MDEETREFIFEIYLPVLDENIGHIQLSLLENAELSENTLGTVIKLLYAFVWQESIVDLGGKNQKLIWPFNIFVFSGLNLTPEANEAGAAFTPKLNAFANNLTRWDLTVEELQLGGGYPGSVGCNNVIPHAKWHAQTSAALSDMMKLMDFVLKLEKQHMY